MKLNFRYALESDIPLLVQLLADDPLGAMREDASHPLDTRYSSAFQCIDSDPNNELIVVEAGGELIGMLQLTFIPYLTHKGSWRCLIEGVRINKKYRGRGLGTELINHAIERATQRKCSIVQLTTDKLRPDAIRFYESSGFTASHEGLKLTL